ncbi:class I SAM-dependent methyltransferase [Candidatus Poriferisodalis sp.]|uniref:class I SAM-dependent methyltransferase n=1 Tax=Candidatus Poriferisodalis sp. TaxID=3101277 RepID=UPI003B0165A4
MTRPAKTDSTQAFSELAEAYSRARPQYPDLLWSTLRERLDHHPVPHSAIDVGSGTGIATRQLARALPGWRVVGVEPGEAMRAAAARDSSDTAIEFRFGTAEDMPLKTSSAGLVLAAQALHWFNHACFYAEAHRVLAPRGLIGIMQNDRALALSPFLEDYESFLEEHSPGYTRDYRDFDIVSELSDAGFSEVSRLSTAWTRSLSHDLFVDLALSSSKMHAAAQQLGEAETARRLQALLNRHHPSGELGIPYVSELFIGRHHLGRHD